MLLFVLAAQLRLLAVLQDLVMMNLLQHVHGGMAQLKLSIPSFTVDRTLWSPTAVWAAWYFLRFGLFARLKQTALTTWPFSLGVVAEISSLRESCLFYRGYGLYVYSHVCICWAFRAYRRETIMVSENVIVNMYRVTSLTEEVQKIGYIFVKETSTVLFTTNKNNLDWEKPIKRMHCLYQSSVKILNN